MQYQSECRNALESAVNISKSFQKVFMDAMKLFMAIPDRINFLQMGRYGCFSEQTYRNNFENDDFEYLDITRCTEYKVNKGKLYGLKAYSKALKRFVRLAVWYPMDGRTDKWQLYFSTNEIQNAQDVLDFYRTRFQLEFCFRDAKQHAGITNCQSTDFRKLAFHFNASLAAINLAKAACKKMGIKYSISSCKSVIHNAYMLERFICVSGIEPNTQLIDKLFKELILFTARAA